MTVSQVNRTTNSVTINVSGIVSGDRQTSIWITDTILGAEYGEWMTLTQAQENGYITDFYASNFDDNNGDITVVIAEEYIEEFKVWDLLVDNVNTGNEPIIISTILGFEYSNEFPKLAGNPVDITPSDMNAINNFGRCIDYWINGGEGYYYSFDEDDIGDKIYSEYLVLPAQNIWNTAYNKRKLLGDYYMVVWNYTSDIVDNCVSGAEFKALWFNGILYAINNFNLSITI